MQPPNTQQKLEKELFGASDDESSDAPLVFTSDDDLPFAQAEKKKKMPLPKFVRKGGDSSQPPPKKRKQRKRKDEEGQGEEQGREEIIVDPEQAKRNEARNDVQAALDRIKPKRQKSTLVEETAIDDMISVLLLKMKEAAEMDHELNKLSQPATAKLMMLDAVQEQLGKAQLWEQLLENQILEGVKAWMEPLHGTGALPSIDIQRAMMKALTNMPIRTDHLRESGIGKVAMFYAKCDLVVGEVKKGVKDVLDKWMRPIMNRSDNYRDRVLGHVDYNPFAVESIKVQGASSEKVISSILSNRARIPLPAQANYDVAPKSFVTGSSDGKISEKHRKLKNKMVMMKRKVKSGKMNIEGR